jgi:hypothetical protein
MYFCTCRENLQATTMTKHGGHRNFGFGKQLSYAGYNALKTAYKGRFGTVAAHASRWGNFARWCKECGVRDAREINHAILLSFGNYLRTQVLAGKMSASYAQNLVSTANVTLAALRCDRSIRLSPSEAVGTRVHVRSTPPSGIDRQQLEPVIEKLQAGGHARAAAVLALTREFGLRLKEASLLNIREALGQAATHGAINVREGTKGGRGREVDRWVPCSPTGIEVLHQALAVAVGGRNLIPQQSSFTQFNDHLHNVASPVLERNGLGTIHDLRAAYACQRYRELTGAPAPVVAGLRAATKAADHAARDVISRELGHGRRDVAACYVGSAR